MPTVATSIDLEPFMERHDRALRLAGHTLAVLDHHAGARVDPVAAVFRSTLTDRAALVRETRADLDEARALATVLS